MDEKILNTQENKETNDKAPENVPEKKKGGKTILLVIIIALVAITAYRFIVYFSNRGNTAEETVKVNVMVQEAVLETISQTAPLTGRLDPVEDVAIVPLAQGKVTGVNVKVGDKVQKGQLLFSIDSSAVAAQAAQARAAYDAVASTYERMQILYSEGAVSLQDFEGVKTQYVSASEALNAANTALSYYSVTSPISGYVTSLNVSVGSIAGGSMAGSVANIDSLVIDTNVSELLATKVKVGDEVSVYIASTGKSYTGKVTSFSPIPGLGTLTYPLTITMDPNEDLFAGMFAEVHITSECIENALCVNSDAVFITGGRSVVCRLDSNNIPEFVPVETGVDNGERVQILSGISAGDIIVCSGQQYVSEGDEVNIVSGGTGEAQ